VPEEEFSVRGVTEDDSTQADARFPALHKGCRMRFFILHDLIQKISLARVIERARVRLD
jgi:hypothetical protein